MPLEDISILKSNGAEYARSHRRATQALRNANGKNSYREIAKIINVHPTTVSALLRKAMQLGLARKVKGVYQKNSGALGFVHILPSKKIKKRSVSDVIENINKVKRVKVSGSSSFNVPNKIFTNNDRMAR